MKKLTPAIAIATVLGIACWWFYGTPPAPYSFPAAEKISEVTAKINDLETGEIKEFTVPPGHYDELLASLAPAWRDPRPMKWVVFGDLAIVTVGGTRIEVHLFDTYSEIGAFAAGPTWEGRTYYRGGNSQRLRAALSAARTAAATEAAASTISP